MLMNDNFDPNFWKKPRPSSLIMMGMVVPTAQASTARLVSSIEERAASYPLKRKIMSSA